MTDPIREAVEAAARQLCICDGECFETRHGMMHGPCEQDFTRARRAIAAFLRALPYHLILADTGGRPVCSGAHWLAAAVEAERE